MVNYYRFFIILFLSILVGACSFNDVNISAGRILYTVEKKGELIEYSSNYNLVESVGNESEKKSDDFEIVKITDGISEISFFVEPEFYNVASINYSKLKAIGEEISRLNVFNAKFSYRLGIHFSSKKSLEVSGFTKLENPSLDFYYPVDDNLNVEEYFPKAFEFIFHEILHVFLIKNKVDVPLQDNEYLVHKGMLCLSEARKDDFFYFDRPVFPSELSRSGLMKKTHNNSPSVRAFYLASYDLQKAKENASEEEFCSGLDAYFGVSVFKESDGKKLVETPFYSSLAYSNIDGLKLFNDSCIHNATLSSLQGEFASSNNTFTHCKLCEENHILTNYCRSTFLNNLRAQGQLDKDFDYNSIYFLERNDIATYVTPYIKSSQDVSVDNIEVGAEGFYNSNGYLIDTGAYHTAHESGNVLNYIGREVSSSLLVVGLDKILSSGKTEFGVSDDIMITPFFVDGSKIFFVSDFKIGSYIFSGKNVCLDSGAKFTSLSSRAILSEKRLRKLPKALLTFPSSGYNERVLGSVLDDSLLKFSWVTAKVKIYLILQEYYASPCFLTLGYDFLKDNLMFIDSSTRVIGFAQSQ
ncbi:hypothetical protein [Alteromonas sp. 14N.309.X.WAT.G.H12]|uniref:hypothetical protein n=1 Tax=Alteromonas sp. 14N.309.X.WAT.G.H12 TaxID=3120824 RepID=UPI002FD3C6DE